MAWLAGSPTVREYWKPFFTPLQKRILSNIIQKYAQTKERDDTEKKKKRLLPALQSTINNLNNTIINLIMGDKNAKVGSEKSSFDEVIRKWGLGERNENGDRFTNFS